jgi:hypothetical protein
VDSAVERRSPQSWPSIARRTVASALSLAITAILLRAFQGRELRPALLIPAIVLVGAPVVAAAAIWTRVLALQLLARAYWWVQLLFASFIDVTDVPDQRAAALALASAGALLLVGRLGLDETGAGRFRPVAFRGTLMLALVLAMADVGTFSWLGMLQVVSGKFRLILFAVPMIAAVIGLLRLRTWGLLVSVVCNLLVAALAAVQRLDLPGQLRWLFIGNAIAQLLIPLPMWVAIVRRRPPPPDGWRRAKAIASTAVILVLAVVNVVVLLRWVPYVAP